MVVSVSITNVSNNPPLVIRSKILLGAEERYRLGVWLENKLLVETHNLLYYKVMVTTVSISLLFSPQGEVSWYLEMNQFADLTPEEFSVRKGLRADRGRRRSHQGARRPGPRGEVPDAIDWNAEGAVRTISGCLRNTFFQ